MYQLYTQKFSTCLDTEITCLLREGTIDFNVIHGCTVDDNYGLRNLAFKDGDVILDLGAYMGGVSLLLASFNKKLTVYAYEPMQENFDLLTRNAELNGLSNIIAHPLAISHKKGKVRLYYADITTKTGQIQHFVGNAANVTARDYTEVDATTLQEIFREHNIQRCKLIKTNIEGNECNILRECPDDVLKRVDHIIGQHHDATRKELLSCTRGLFEDMPHKFNSDSQLGLFWFKNVQTVLDTVNTHV
jgi:FkbM family methyltransferase